jgi:hypothetical protein
VTPPLEQVLADAEGEAQLLRKHGHERQAEVLERLCATVKAAARDYLTWLTEAEAELKSGHGTGWLRYRFARWEAQGLAKKDGRRRLYRSIIVPQRRNIEAARAAAKRALGRAS